MIVRANNVLTQTDPDGHVWSFTYDNRNRKLSQTDPLGHTTSYTYDGASNVLTVTRPDGGVTTNTYDNMNRLLTTTDPKGETTTMTYDGAGDTTYLIYDGWDLIEERDGSGTLLATYVHGVRHDELLTKSTIFGTVYYHHNGLGSVTDLTDGIGTLLEKYKYDAYGKAAIFDGSGSSLTASAYGNRFLFMGHEYLSEVNLYDWRTRFYSADLGRFLQTDPLRFSAGDVNIYRYCGNNPINITHSRGEIYMGSTPSKRRRGSNGQVMSDCPDDTTGPPPNPGVNGGTGAGGNFDGLGDLSVGEVLPDPGCYDTGNVSATISTSLPDPSLTLNGVPPQMNAYDYSLLTGSSVNPNSTVNGSAPQTVITGNFPALTEGEIEAAQEQENNSIAQSESSTEILHDSIDDASRVNGAFEALTTEGGLEDLAAIGAETLAEDTIIAVVFAGL